MKQRDRRRDEPEFDDIVDDPVAVNVFDVTLMIADRDALDCDTSAFPLSDVCITERTAAEPSSPTTTQIQLLHIEIIHFIYNVQFKVKAKYSVATSNALLTENTLHKIHVAWNNCSATYFAVAGVKE